MVDFEQAARENLERHIGDVCDGDTDLEVIRNEAWTLAFDGAVNAGAPHEEACRVAWNVVEELY